MPSIELSRKRIDPRTGSQYVEKKVFKLNADGDPRDSIVFHQTADLLNIGAFDRTNPHVYRKLAVLYNWASEGAESNDPYKVADYIEKYQKKLGVNSLGKELLDQLYKRVRLDLDARHVEKKYEEKIEKQKEIEQSLKSDSRKARELKKSSVEHKKSIERDSEEANRRIQEVVEAWRSALPKDNTMKARVVKEKSDREEFVVGEDYV